MKIGCVLTLAAIGLVAPISAQAASVLNFSVTADNAFQIYLSTDNSQLGTLVYSNYGLTASQWQTSFQFSANLTAPIEYVHVIGSNYTPENGLFPPSGRMPTFPSAIRRHFLATLLNGALWLRGVACKTRKMRLEARHGEIHECADLRNGKPTLWGNEVQGYRGVLVVREKDLQRGLRKLLSDVIREKSGDAASFDG